MTDICVSGGGGAPGNAQKYCSCAGPALESALTVTQKDFVRLNPKENFSIAGALLPAVGEVLSRCGGQ
jgi:hypothetical protein